MPQAPAYSPATSRSASASSFASCIAWAKPSSLSSRRGWRYRNTTSLTCLPVTCRRGVGIGPPLQAIAKNRLGRFRGADGIGLVIDHHQPVVLFKQQVNKAMKRAAARRNGDGNLAPEAARGHGPLYDVAFYGDAGQTGDFILVAGDAFGDGLRPRPSTTRASPAQQESSGPRTASTSSSGTRSTQGH